MNEPAENGGEIFELWRQDDNGHRYLVDRFSSRADATAALREFESHHHKQFYWITAVPK